MIDNYEINNCEILIKIDDGLQIKVDNIQRVCISEERSEYYSSINNDMPLAMLNNKLVDIKLNHTTRKRFIKLLMSKGIQRNCAVDIAKYCVNKYRYYSQKFLLLF